MTELPSPAAARPVHDILLAADLTRSGDRAFRLAQEIRAHADRGSTVGLVQIRPPRPGEAIAPEIATCIRRGLARVVPSGEDITAARMVVHGPGDADPSFMPDPPTGLAEVILVAHAPQDLAALTLVPGVARRVFAANPVLRALAADPISAQDWLPLPAAPAGRPMSVPGRLPAIAWIATQGLAEADLAACSRPGAEHFGWSGSPMAMPPIPDLSLDRMVAALDVFVVAPAEDDHSLPDTVICAALMAGRPVVMPGRLHGIYGKGPCYFDPGDLHRCLDRVLAAPDAGHGAQGAGFVARCRRSPARPAAFSGRRRARPRPAPPDTADRALLCVAANGVGVGHLTRLLAIARRTTGPVVFATHAPAVGVVAQFGYPVEYIPSPAAVGGDIDLWDAWFKVHLDHLLDAWDPAVVAFDGNHPTPGLIAAVAARRDCRLAWVRRGMWGQTTSPWMANARWCDLVIEPGEMAAERDRGITAQRRPEALQVEPILLLDPSDLPDRRQAAAHLGLNPARPAVLIQLGSGHNRDLLSLLDQIVAVLSEVPGLQIAVAEWVNGSVPLTLWPQVTLLRGFPIAQFARAFDFCISAAGYNAFHEAIAFGLPTIFVANRHPTMDDQHGRARFAQDNAAAFELSETDLSDLPDLVRILMQDKARAFLAENCARIARPNGAAAAASALATLAAQDSRAMP